MPRKKRIPINEESKGIVIPMPKEADQVLELELALDQANNTIEALEFSLATMNKEYKRVLNETEIFLGAIALMNDKATFVIPSCFLTTMQTNPHYKAYYRINEIKDVVINVIEERTPPPVVQEPING